MTDERIATNPTNYAMLRERLGSYVWRMSGHATDTAQLTALRERFTGPTLRKHYSRRERRQRRRP